MKPCTPQDVINSLRMIPESDFSPESAIELIAALSSRIAHSNFAHIQNQWIDANAAIEYLDDAHSKLGG